MSLKVTKCVDMRQIISSNAGHTHTHIYISATDKSTWITKVVGKKKNALMAVNKRFAMSHFDL